MTAYILKCSIRKVEPVFYLGSDKQRSECADAQSDLRLLFFAYGIMHGLLKLALPGSYVLNTKDCFLISNVNIRFLCFLAVTVIRRDFFKRVILLHVRV